MYEGALSGQIVQSTFTRVQSQHFLECVVPRILDAYELIALLLQGAIVGEHHPARTAVQSSYSEEPRLACPYSLSTASSAARGSVTVADTNWLGTALMLTKLWLSRIARETIRPILDWRLIGNLKKYVYAWLRDHACRFNEVSGKARLRG